MNFTQTLTTLTDFYIEVSIFISTKTKQNILPALWFWVCFHLSILTLFGWKCILFDMFLPIIHTEMPKNGNGNNSIWRFLWHPFQKLPFSPIHARNNGFSRLHFWNDSMMKVFVSVIRHFSVDDRQKHIKKVCVFIWKYICVVRASLLSQGRCICQ